MLKDYAIGYDRFGSHKCYDGLMSEIFDIDPEAQKILVSQWSLRSMLSAEEIKDRLGRHFQPGDKLIVAEVAGDRSVMQVGHS